VAPIGSKGANLLLFRPRGGGKSHLAAALALVENGWRVLFTRNSDLVQRLQIARRELALESALAKLDKYHQLILDDIVVSTRIKPKLLAKESEKQACRTMVGLLAIAHDPIPAGSCRSVSPRTRSAKASRDNGLVAYTHGA
jgi:IstB-like ATP binding protein